MAKQKIAQPNGWQIKDRIYRLKGDSSPVLYVIPSKHTRRKPMLWFDEENGTNEELRYATNMNSPIVKDQKGVATLGHIAFRNGVLMVPKRLQALQKLLSLYHPLKNIIYYEHDEVKNAEEDVAYMEAEIEALIAAKGLDIEHAEAMLRVEVGGAVSKMTSKEIKRDILLMARNNPSVFLELLQDDNVELRNIGLKAVEANIIKMSANNRTFQWASNGRKLFTVPLEEHPYSALAAWFKTDEGMEVLNSIQKRL
jgi:hypothetical protein